MLKERGKLWSISSSKDVKPYFLFVHHAFPRFQRFAFATWSSFAQGAVMAVLSVHLRNERGELLITGAFFTIIGAVLIALAPAKQPAERASTAVL